MRYAPTSYLPVVAALALTACGTPSTDTPTYTTDELRAEQDAQSKAAKEAPLYFDDKKNYGYKQIDALDVRLKPVAERVQRAAAQMCEDLRHGAPQDEDDNCIFTVSMAPHKHALNAYANGRMAVIYPAMVDFLKTNDQLAFVLSHEMAHNVMHHIDKKKDNATYGIALGTLSDFAFGAVTRVNNKGGFSKLGAQTGGNSFSPAFEAEADYVGLYIMARAGYNIDKAPDVWRIMSQAQPDAIYVTTTHPNNPARTIAMTKTVAEIHAKQRAHQPLIPNIQA